jgi:hypothetical protein
MLVLVLVLVLVLWVVMVVEPALFRLRGGLFLVLDLVTPAHKVEDLMEVSYHYTSGVLRLVGLVRLVGLSG